MKADHEFFSDSGFLAFDFSCKLIPELINDQIMYGAKFMKLLWIQNEIILQMFVHVF